MRTKTKVKAKAKIDLEKARNAVSSHIQQILAFNDETPEDIQGISLTKDEIEKALASEQEVKFEAFTAKNTYSVTYVYPAYIECKTTPRNTLCAR
jgi:nucleoid-associated protein YejK